ncbi:Uncharacterized conserved protein [Marisediminitalea aggregata]|uniref:DNA 3'-5' helicase II n=1 Tax=Marisediminitalea aggregata TaxID=634436 RepID=A0A1M5N532_9ALTE|nr:DNA/RNA helicase domain-containing protein [Marisediminitalea aggregata]MCP4274656.1 AAA family ATPase [Gammaproteobacteria bacterium]SHG84555.1 Uncharacterized conserved protein [Marisediminitalea aggregata]
MAKRIFELPKEHELTKDQRMAIRKPVDGQYLVVGAPGTGKSVVALWRLRKYASDNDIVFLSFNHVLNHANKELAGSNEAYMSTAISWLYEFQWKASGGSAANYHEAKMPEEDNHKPDYPALIERFEALNANCSTTSFIIDEGQDLPQGWYEAVESLNVENFFIVADQNQQITEENSSQDELADVLGLDKNEIIHLKENWRNTTPISAFANYFYTDKSSPKPELPNKPSAHVPILYEYEKLESVKELILSSYDNDPSKLIGLFVANETKREHWARDLKNDKKQRREAPPVVSTYYYQQKGNVNIDFSQGGIVVLNDKSVKGIEFDEVFIIIDGFKAVGGDIESLKKRMYVMASRARERLFLVKSEVQNSVIEDILPPEGETFQIERNNTIEEYELLKRIKI